MAPFLPPSAEIRQLLAAGGRFSAFVAGPPASGKTTVLAQAVRDAVDGGLDLEEVAAFAPTRLMFGRLAEAIAEPWPEFDAPAVELFPRGQRGVPFDAVAAHAELEGEPAGQWFEGAAASEWAAFCARTCEVALDDAFLAGLKPKFRAALRVDRRARLAGAALPPDDVYLHGVSAFVDKLKRERGVVDRADILRAAFEPSPRVGLLALDEVGEADRDRLERLFPNASVVATGVSPRQGEAALDLPRALRATEVAEVACDPPLAPPPPDGFRSLFVVAPRWRRGQWLEWMARYGVPPPRDWRWRATVEAWAAGGEVGAHAVAVLGRHGTLEDLPLVRMGPAPGLRGLEAEVAYVDLGKCPPDLADVALTRATRRLVVVR